MVTDTLNRSPVDMRILGQQDNLEAFRTALQEWLREVTPTFNMERMTAISEEEGAQLQIDWLAEREKVGLGQPHWPKEFGGPGWTAVQKHLFEEECALAGAPRIVPFGPVMVAPVIMAFGSPEQQKRFLPGIASGEVWWSQG